MVEVSTQLYLGSEDDAGEVVYGKRHKDVTHILSITRDSPSWLLARPAADEETDGHNENDREDQTTPTTEIEGVAEGETEERPRRDFVTLHVKANDSPKADLLNHFERCCAFIQQGLDGGGVFVHW